MPAGSEWVEHAAARGRLRSLGLRQVWRYRELALIFATREIRLRYKQTAFGIAWILLQPLGALAIFSLIFGRVLEVDSEGVPYPVFAYVGLVVWTAVSTAVSRAAESLTADPDLVTKVYFPRLLAPLGAALPVILDAAVGFVLLAPLMLVYGTAPAVTVLALPLCMLLLLVLVLGIGIWLAALNVLYRDARYALSFGLQAWFLATPILYPASLLDGEAAVLLFLNPAAGVMEVFRGCILGTAVDAAGVAISAAVLVVLLVTGAAYFRTVERRFADRI